MIQGPDSIPADSGGRTPPQALDAERMVLGAMMLDREAIGRALEVLDEEAFYRRAHKRIYQCLISLYDRGEAADVITVADDLAKRGWLEEVGGASFLSSLIEEIGTAAHIEYHARIVLEKATLRRLIQASGTIMSDAYDQRLPSSELLDKAEEAIFSISENRDKKAFTSLRELMNPTFHAIEEQAKKKSPITGVETGFADLDLLTAGLQPSDLVIVAGRPSMGKTAFCLNVAENAAMKSKVPVAVFSLEMSKEQLIRRLLCSQSRVSGQRLRTGFLRDTDWPALAAAANRLAGAPIYIDDTPAPTVLEMRAKSRRLKAEVDLGLIIIDYLQLVRGAPGTENRQQEISQISRSLKALAKELKVPVVALSQLSRAVESRGGDKRPMLSDLRECVTGDTLVCLADGRRVPIRDLVGQEPEVLAMSPEGHIVKASSDKVWEVGRRPVWSVRLASGRRIRATGRHRLFGADGWVRVDELSIGDRLAIARRLPEPEEPADWSSARAAQKRPSRTSFAGNLVTSMSGSNVELFDSPRESGLVFDRVVSIEPAGTELVYDLTVPGPASWLADGIVSHNSGAIEQDADVVMFVYRPAMYDKNDENENLAEIIIAKQRNGPTDTVNLTFLRDQTRFASLDRRHAGEPFPTPAEMEEPF
jgi:replicative DNA helicase